MTTENEAAIRGLIKAFVDSWNRHDMTMFAALFAEDADFVDVFLATGTSVITSVIHGVTGSWRIIALQNTTIAAQQSAVT
jgi:ketosteroid isomerase-like protein